MTDQEHDAQKDKDDGRASGLIGGYIGHYKVAGREKPGKRVVYVLIDGSNGREVRLPGYQVVRLAREAINSGLPVIRLDQPWRNER